MGAVVNFSPGGVSNASITYFPAELGHNQRPLYDDMRKGIEANFQGFIAINEAGQLIGPWNPWIHFATFGGPLWELVKALSAAPALPKSVREVVILVTGAHTSVLHTRRGTGWHLR
jgi:hypothetical protein